MSNVSEREFEAARVQTVRELEVLNGQTFAELDRLTGLAADICGAEAALLSVFDETHENQVSVSSGERTRKPREVTFCNHTLRGRASLLIPDAREDERLCANPYVTGEPFVCSYAGVCVAADGRVPVGVLCVIDSRPRRFGEEEMRRLRRIADLVSAFFETRLRELRAARAALRTREERERQMQFELIFDSIQEGVNVYALDGRIVESNPAAHRLLGLTREQQLGRAYVDPRWQVVDADGERLAPENLPIARLLQKGETSYNVVLGVDVGAEGRRWISVNAVPVRSPDSGQMEYGVVTFKDMTAQREAEQKLKDDAVKLAEALQRAEAGSQAKTDFLGVMSHELRTPMNAVMGCAALLKQSPLSAPQARTLGVLEDASRQMLALLNDLFDLASLDADKVRLSSEPVSLVRLIEDAAVIWAAEVRAKGLTLSVMIDPALVKPRMVDPARVLQIIGNLMANAIKFTSEGHVAIQAWPEKGSNRIAIEVEDTGPGVPDEAAARIFSPFEQVDVSTTRRHGGLGIGLYVARRLALAMGGDVELESRLGEGSRFTVRIAAPLAEAPSDASEAKAEQAKPAARNVLCVDDNARNLYVLGAILQAAGHRVVECASGEEALEALAKQRFDVVLLDMVMPGVDGVTVLSRVRGGAGPNANTPVIACTANVMPEQIRTYTAAGANGVIAKPIDVAEVLKVVGAATAGDTRIGRWSCAQS